jgi:DNA-binding NarL/FixJ family response regulator
MSVLVADDSEPLRRAIRRCFGGQSEITLVGEARDFADAIRLAEQLRPDVVLLDLRMNDSYGLDALAAGPKLISTGATILAMSFTVDDDSKALAKQIGAVGLLDKVNLYAELILALRVLQRGPDGSSAGTARKSD